VTSDVRAIAAEFRRSAGIADDDRGTADPADGSRANVRAVPDQDQGDSELRAIASRYAPVNWEKAWEEQPDEVEWLVEPFIEAGTLNAMFAKPGTGKSLLALEWALRLVRGGHTVVYLDDENRITDIVERLQAMGSTPSELDQLLLYSFAGLPPLDTPAGGVHLLSLAVATGAVMVVIDTTSRMIAGSENDSDTFLGLYMHSMKPLKARGVAVLRLDHPGKDSERGQRGSSAKDGDVDAIYNLLEIQPGRKYGIRREKTRSGHGGTKGEVIEITREYAPVRHVWTVRTGAPKITPLGQLCGQLSALVPLSAGRDACRTALKRAGITASNDLLTEVIKHRKLGCDCPDEWRTGSDRSDRQSSDGELSASQRPYRDAGADRSAATSPPFPDQGRPEDTFEAEEMGVS
jgi:hypothetical protein